MPEISSSVDDSSVIVSIPPGATTIADVGIYFSKKGAVGVTIRDGEELKIGETIMYQSNGTWKSRTVDSIQKDRISIDIATSGQIVGIFIGEPVDVGSVIYCLPPPQ